MLIDELHDVSIDDLLNTKQISIRTSNCCRCAQFNSLYDIVSYFIQGNSFLKIRNAGRRTCDELEHLCRDIILEITNLPYQSNIINESIKKSKTELRVIQNALIENEYSKLLNNCSARIFNVLRQFSADEFISSFLYCQDDKLCKFRNIGVKSANEIIEFKTKFKAFVEGVEKKVTDFPYQSSSVNEQTETQKQDILNVIQKKIIGKEYSRLLSGCSSRTCTVLRQFSADEFISSYLYCKERELLKIKNIGKKSINEVIEFKTKFKTFIEKTRHIEDPLQYFRLEVKYKYGDFCDNEFIVDFFKRENHLPMFWILEQYILNDKSKEIEILMNSFKIFSKSDKYLENNIIGIYKVQSLDEIADKLNLSRERVRQIRNDVFHKTFEIANDNIEHKRNSDLSRYTDLLQNKSDWAYILEFVQETALNQESVEIQECLKQEQCDLSTEFVLQIIAYLFRDTFSLFGGFEVSNRDKIWRNTFLIRKEFTDIFDFEKFIEEFKNHIANNEIEYNLNIDDSLTNSACWTSVIDLNKFDDIVSIVKDILLYECHLYSNFDGLITIPAAKEINLLDAVYKILQKNEHPMHLDEIFVKFKNIFPEHKYTEAEQLRSWLQRHEAITCINRKSVYTLKEWKHIRAGTIRDAIVEFLNSRNSPQSIENITNYVTQFFQTTQKNVHGTMFSGKKFIQYKNGLFGLSNKQYLPEYERMEQRKSFEQRLYDFEKFLIENDHFPFSSSDNEDEPALYSWWRTQCKNIDKLTELKKTAIERIKSQYGNYKTNKDNYEWDLNYNKLKCFLLEYSRLPSESGSERFLYDWLNRAKDNFMDDKLTEEQRKKYVEIRKII